MKKITLLILILSFLTSCWTDKEIITKEPINQWDVKNITTLPEVNEVILTEKKETVSIKIEDSIIPNTGTIIVKNVDDNKESTTLKILNNFVKEEKTSVIEDEIAVENKIVVEVNNLNNEEIIINKIWNGNLVEVNTFNIVPDKIEWDLKFETWRPAFLDNNSTSSFK